MRPTGSRETGAVNAAGFVEEPTFLEGALAGALGDSEAGAGDSDGSEEVGVAGVFLSWSKTECMASMVWRRERRAEIQDRESVLGL